MLWVCKKSGYNYTLYYLSLDEVEYVGADGDFWVRILVVWQNNQSHEYNFRFTKKSIWLDWQLKPLAGMNAEDFSHTVEEIAAVEQLSETRK